MKRLTLKRRAREAVERSRLFEPKYQTLAARIWLMGYNARRRDTAPAMVKVSDIVDVTVGPLTTVETATGAMLDALSAIPMRPPFETATGADLDSYLYGVKRPPGMTDAELREIIRNRPFADIASGAAFDAWRAAHPEVAAFWNMRSRSVFGQRRTWTGPPANLQNLPRTTYVCGECRAPISTGCYCETCAAS